MQIFDPKLLRRSPARVKRVRRWIRLLRSAKSYQQGDSYLRTVGEKRSEDRFCCLGVALDLVDPGGWKDIDLIRAEEPHEGTDAQHRLGDADNPSQMLNEKACRLYGLIQTKRPIDGGDALLANWNDTGMKFPEIGSRLQSALTKALRP